MRGVYCIYIKNPEDIPTWNIFGISISLYFIFLLYCNLDGLIAHFGNDNRFGYGLRCCVIDSLGSTQLLAVYSIEAYSLVIVETRERHDTVV